MRSIRVHSLVIFAFLACASMAALAEVVVTGTAIKKMRDTGYAVQSIDADSLIEPTTDLTDIATRISGVQIGTGTGNAGANITIRGVGSSTDLTPLYIVNGIPTENFSDIDPNDVETIQVLKGTAASTLYGTRGAAGVVIINLKTRDPAQQTAELFASGAAGTPGNNNPAGLTAAGLYSEYSSGYSGALDLNSYCDFGAATVKPGWAMNPWINKDWNAIENDGDSYLLPYDFSALLDSGDPVVPPATPATPTAPATPTPAAATQPPATPVEQPAVTTPAPTASKPPLAETPDTRTDLERWTRGAPPWSIVVRSPECAHLLSQLQPKYKARDDARSDLVKYGDFTLSAWKLREYEPKLADAKQRIKTTTADIVNTLKLCKQPEEAKAEAATLSKSKAKTVAATATLSKNEAGKPLPRLNIGDLNGYTNFAKLINNNTGFVEDLYEAYLDDLYEEWLDDPYVEDEELCELCGEWEEWSWKEMDWVTSRYQDLYDEWDEEDWIYSRLYVTKRIPAVDRLRQILKLEPATDAALTPTYPYKIKFAMPSDGGYPDYEFNSDRGSNIGFPDRTGQIRYDTPRFGSFNLDGLIKRIAAGEKETEKRPDDASRWPQPTYTGSYDFVMDGRLRFGPSYYNKDSDSWKFPQTPVKQNPPATDFDATRYQMGYNLTEKWAAFTTDATPFDGQTVTLDNYTGPAVRSLNDLPPSFIAKVSNPWGRFLSGAWTVNDKLNINFSWREPAKPATDMLQAVQGAYRAENDFCATEAFPVNGTIAGIRNGTRVHDQWATRNIGFSPDEQSATRLINAQAKPVIVAVIDTGLDWHHRDFSWDNLWNNPDEIPDNNIDDDNNGFVDDMFGWDFLAFDNKPWDDDGHGTFVTGLIAAAANNSAGIDGINPNARIMVLKALNNFGHTRASWLAQAVIYAVDNGARIINLSAAGPGLPMVVQEALDYANENGVLVVVAAGNTAENVDGIEPAGLQHAITVAATGLDDARAPFSNWGDRVDIAAPGVHVMSLRARQTDFRITSADGPYVPGSAIVGLDRRYYRADGTSFSAPLVTAVASLLWSNNPSLTHVQVRRMLEQSARDIDAPGRDQFTGYGLLDARAALAADPDYFIVAAINAVSVASVNGQPVAQVTGTAEANEFASAWLEIGAGENPSDWKRVGEALDKQPSDGALGNIPASELEGSPVWIVRVIVKHRDGTQREARYTLNIG